VNYWELKIKSIVCDLIIKRREKAVNKQIMAIAATATLFMGGVALADSTIKATPPASDASAPADKGATGNGGMAGTPSAEKSSGVEGRSGSQSGAPPADKMAPDKK
jgi:hypothetical protein